MKKNYLILLLFPLLLNSTTGFCTSHTIVNAGFTFSPDSISANVGDTIIFSLSTFHTVVEVNQATWSVNGNTPNGGFQLPAGGGMVVLTQAKTYYYVCGIHFAMGMKGRIFVTNPAEVNSVSYLNNPFEIVPNPAIASTVIKANLHAGEKSSMQVYDIIGNALYVKENISPFETIDLSSFASGIYFVQIKGSAILQVKKLTVLK
jgi:plastocyanin